MAAPRLTSDQRSLGRRRDPPALDALALRLDGKAAAAKTVSHRRASFYNALRYAVELGRLPGNPIDNIQLSAPKAADRWGLLDLSKSSPRVSSAWTDSGESHDDRGLKHRAKDDSRLVPIPPELVLLLQRHVATSGTGADGRLFWGTRGLGILAESVYGPVWHKARDKALTKTQAASKLIDGQDAVNGRIMKALGGETGSQTP